MWLESPGVQIFCKLWLCEFALRRQSLAEFLELGGGCAFPTLGNLITAARAFVESAPDTVGTWRCPGKVLDVYMEGMVG